MNITTYQRLVKANAKVQEHPNYKPLAGLMLLGKSELADVPTACTNGVDCFYGREFIDDLTDAELRFIVIHEMFHIKDKDLHTYDWMHKKDPQVANMALDYYNNQVIVDENPPDPKTGKCFAVMPKGGLLDEQFRGWTKPKIFYHLLAEKDQQQENPGDDGDDDGDNTSTGFDSHDWEGAKEMSEVDKKQLDRDIDSAIRQGVMASKKMGNAVSRELEELFEPQIDWVAVLRDFVSANCTGKTQSTYRRPNRKQAWRGLYLPSTHTKEVGDVVFATDLSASCWDYLPYYHSEVKSILDRLRPQSVRMLYWDTEVTKDEKYTGCDVDTLLSNTKPKGGGGTDVECVPKYMRDERIKPQCAIVFTDGYVWNGWGQWDCPVLWVILDNPNCVPSCGKVLHIKSEDLQ